MPVPLMLVSAAALVVASACPGPRRAHEMTTGSEFDLARRREPERDRLKLNQLQT